MIANLTCLPARIASLVCINPKSGEGVLSLGHTFREQRKLELAVGFYRSRRLVAQRRRLVRAL